MFNIKYAKKLLRELKKRETSLEREYLIFLNYKAINMIKKYPKLKIKFDYYEKKNNFPSSKTNLSGIFLMDIIVELYLGHINHSLKKGIS